MTENNMETPNTIDHNARKFSPKINIQAVILGLIALIAIFQSFQLVRINAKANTSSVKTSPAITASSQPQNAASNSDVPQAMVGGC